MCINGTFGFLVLDDKIKHTSVFMGLDYCIHFWIEYHVSWSMVTDWESKAILKFSVV